MITRNTFLLLISVLIGAVGGAHAQEPDWQVDFTAYEHSHNVTAAVLLEGSRLAGGDHRLAAFVNGELRGVAEPTQVGTGWLFFLAIYGDASGERVSFRVYEASTGAVYAIHQALDFAVNGISGSPSTPFWLETADVVTAAEHARPAGALFLGQNYPNPFSSATDIPFTLGRPAYRRMEVFDLLGRRVRVLVDGTLSPGRHTTRFEDPTLSPGIYLYRLTAEGAEVSRLMVHER